MTQRDREVIVKGLKLLHNASLFLMREVHIETDIQEPLKHLAQAIVLLRRLTATGED